MEGQHGARHPRPLQARLAAVDRVEVDLVELIRVRDQHRRYMELARRQGDVPPGALAMSDHFLLVLERAGRGRSCRGEVEELLKAAEEFDQWRQERDCKLPPAAEAIRIRALDVLHRLAATLPEEPSPAADPDKDVAWPIKPMTMTVEAFAHAIGKSPRTVYRMARNGQLFVYREGAGRGTVLIYCDQVEPANRPPLAAPAN